MLWSSVLLLSKVVFILLFGRSFVCIFKIVIRISIRVPARGHALLNWCAMECRQKAQESGEAIDTTGHYVVSVAYLSRGWPVHCLLIYS